MEEICTLNDLMEHATEPINVIRFQLDDGKEVMIAIATNGWTIDKLGHSVDLISGWFNNFKDVLEEKHDTSI